MSDVQRLDLWLEVRPGLDAGDVRERAGDRRLGTGGDVDHEEHEGQKTKSTKHFLGMPKESFVPFVCFVFVLFVVSP